MDARNYRAQKAQETLLIIEKGFYTVNGRQIDTARFIQQSINKAQLYSPEAWEAVQGETQQIIAGRNFQTRIAVKNCTSIEAALPMQETNGKTGCLNFASAKNPGGGFLNGAQAQEESLARNSALYPTLTKFQREMYDYNRSLTTYLYSDYMIYSPDVVFFKNDANELLAQPFLLDILTSPAVNVGAIKQNNPLELSQVEQTMLSRIDKMLSVFVLQKVEKVILGAWGCGVFQNKPEDVAAYFAHYLTQAGKYGKCFREIVFAVFDKSRNQENIRAFEKVFEQI
ncbi:MAG: TIGR02452 family protein [Candidatus Azobacteroides sp.]|nr:TIGR02452 family protein [Candidatus Azobacteroides sp.]